MTSHIKEADSNWQKKAGLDLRLDKTKVLKEALVSAEENGQNLPKSDSAQVFKRKWEKKKTVQSDEAEFSWQFIRHEAMKKLRNLRKLHDPDVQRKKLRAVEGMLWVALSKGGFFTDSEADEIVDAYVYCQESPSLHPLQTAFPKGYVPRKFRTKAFAKVRSVEKTLVFDHPPLKSALARRGYFLNNGFFSSAESVQLMKNFDEFLLSRGYSTDQESKWNLLRKDFFTFYRETKLFLYVGKGLNRSSHQLKLRLIALHHGYKRDRVSAQEDEFVLREVEALKSRGFYRRFKRIGDQLGRFNQQVKGRYHYLTSSMPLPPDPQKLHESIANLEDKNIIASLEDIPFHMLASENGMSENDLRSYWFREGKQRYLRSKLPRWTLADTLELLDKIQESGEDEENCVDFEGIFDRHFRGKVVDWKHLREHFGRIRRVVPYYMLDDLQSIVSVAKKHVKKRLRKRKRDRSSAEGEPEETCIEDAEADEDMFEEESF